MIPLKTTPQNLRPFLAAKHVESQFDLCGVQCAVSVSTPDLSQCPLSVWGDWGPMYSCELDPLQYVIAQYRCDTLGTSAEHHFSPPKIGVFSPPLALERARHPLYLDIPDPARGVRLHVYLSPNGEVDTLEVKKIHPSLDVVPLIFPESRQPRLFSTTLGSYVEDLRKSA